MKVFVLSTKEKRGILDSDIRKRKSLMLKATFDEGFFDRPENVEELLKVMRPIFVSGGLVFDVFADGDGKETIKYQVANNKKPSWRFFYFSFDKIQSSMAFDYLIFKEFISVLDRETKKRHGFVGSFGFFYSNNEELILEVDR